MVEPQQVALRTSRQLLVFGLIRLAILRRGAAARGLSTVEANTERVGLMVVHGTPLQRVVGFESVRLGTVVVVELEDVVQAERHHVVDAGFARTQHEAEELL